jgi:hypothetical protein
LLAWVHIVRGIADFVCGLPIRCRFDGKHVEFQGGRRVISDGDI